jgi:cobalt-zinc-cadmium efflux system outer membrane protein
MPPVVYFNRRLTMRSLSSIAPLAFLGLLISHSSLAETALARAFADAWQRQPAVAALFERERAAAAKIDASSAWTATPPSLELSLRSDRFNRRNGAQENEIGLVLPLWLPGERSSSQALAEAEVEEMNGHNTSRRLRLARTVRETWWAWQSARNEVALAGERVAAATRLRDDVARRLAAGDLSRADLNQAAGALAQGMALQAEAQSAELGFRYQLESLSGRPVGDAEVRAEPEPGAAVVEHPALRELAIARRGSPAPGRSGAGARPGQPGTDAVDADRPRRPRRADRADLGAGPAHPLFRRAAPGCPGGDRQCRGH